MLVSDYFYPQAALASCYLTYCMGMPPPMRFDQFVPLLLSVTLVSQCLFSPWGMLNLRLITS